MHRFNLSVRYAVLPKSSALYPECVHYRLNWAEKGVLVSARKSGHSLCAHVAGNNRPRCPTTDLRLLCHAIIILAMGGESSKRQGVLFDCWPFS